MYEDANQPAGITNTINNIYDLSHPWTKEGEEQAWPWDKAEARGAWAQPPAACSAPVLLGPLQSPFPKTNIHTPVEKPFISPLVAS